MCYDEELQVRYDIQATLFELPALSVQPLVENAVKYGLGKKTGGGTLTISSQEREEAYEIKVADDGVGYNQYEKHYDGRTHIGIDNVRNRLWSMCRATLTIESIPDLGTTAIITIPKGGRG
ncbi:ATP-binding protein [Eubacterium aggregans]|uniref:ATP-binding protein n=1 Tax=Eubacterium aggregans TaxID=81409 RepID=UPI003F3582F2